jgi:hypothetical protein
LLDRAFLFFRVIIFSLCSWRLKKVKKILALPLAFLILLRDIL